MDRHTDPMREWEARFGDTVWGYSSEGPAFWEWPGMTWRWCRRQLAPLFRRRGTAAEEQSPPAS